MHYLFINITTFHFSFAAKRPKMADNNQNNQNNQEKKEEKPKKNAPPVPGVVRRKKKRGPAAAVKIPQVFPTAKCKLRLLKLERIKDYLLMEQEFIQNQEIKRPREEQNEVSGPM